MTAAVLAIVVALGEGQSPATTGMIAAAARAVGPATSIRLIEVKEPSDASALRVERELHAGLVVTVIWKEPARLHALVRLHVARSDRWTTRAIEFSPRDTLEQRGRTLGLAVASAWPETLPVIGETTTKDEASRSGTAPAPKPNPTLDRTPPNNSPATPTLPGPPAPPAPPPAEAAAESSPVSPTPAAPRMPPEDGAVPVTALEPGSGWRPTAGDEIPERTGIGVAAVGAVGAGGPAAALGGSLDAAWFATTALCVRMGIGLRGGSVPALPGSDLLGVLGVGFEWWLAPTVAGQSWAVGARMDGLLLRHQIRFTAPNGQTETQRRFLPGTDLILQSSIRLADGIQLLLGVGAELAFGATDIRRGTDRLVVATIPPLRGLAQAGFRVRF